MTSSSPSSVSINKGTLPGLNATVGIVVVILGVVIVNLPRAESPSFDPAATPPGIDEGSARPASPAS